jgi:hypothetical protein
LLVAGALGLTALAQARSVRTPQLVGAVAALFGSQLALGALSTATTSAAAAVQADSAEQPNRGFVKAAASLVAPGGSFAAFTYTALMLGFAAAAAVAWRASVGAPPPAIWAGDAVATASGSAYTVLWSRLAAAALVPLAFASRTLRDAAAARALASAPSARALALGVALSVAVFGIGRGPLVSAAAVAGAAAMLAVPYGGKG